MSRNKLFSILVVYALWGFVFSKTVYGATWMVYASFSVLLCLFASLYFKKEKKNDSICRVWTPYFFITIIALLLKGDMEMFAYWAIGYFILGTNTSLDAIQHFPYKTLFYCGVVSLIGIGVQMMFPSFYYSYINSTFIETNSLESWAEEEYGYAGFTYQLASTALPIVYASSIVLYASVNLPSFIARRKVLKYVLFTILVIGVFLTGKRALSIFVIIAPIIITFFSKKNTGVKIFGVIMFCIVGYFALQFFIQNAANYVNDPLLKRFAESVIESQMGGDVSSGRVDLYALAINAFYDHPIFGIGIGNFIPYTHAYTSVHNTYLQVLCEQGIIGFLFFIIPIFYCLQKTIVALRKSINKSNQLKLSLFFQLCFIFYGLTGNVTSGLSSFGIYFLGIGLLQCYFSNDEDITYNTRSTCRRC